MRRSSLVVALLAVVALAACSREEPGHAPEAAAPTPVAVAVETVEPRGLPVTLEVVGTVRSRWQSALSSKIVAVVRAIHVQEGDRVRAGQLVVELDDRDPGAQLSRARAALAETRAALAEVEAAIVAAERAVEAARAQEELTRATHERWRTLVQREIVAAQEFEEVAARYKVARAEAARAEEVHASLLARRSGARARIEQADAELTAASIVLGYTRITAPGDAVVVAKHAEVGNLAAPGVVLLTLEEERYRLEATVQESDLPRLGVGQPAAVAVDALGRTLRGPIGEIVPAADPVSRTFVVKVDLPPTPGLRSGLYGKAEFVLGQRSGLTVSTGAVSERGQLQAVFVVGDDAVARLRLVKLGQVRGDRAEILSGLRAGERVVVDGVARLLDGTPVEVRR